MNLLRFAQQLERIARVPRGKMRQQQPPHAGVARDLRRFTRRRMPRLHRTLGLFVAECRLVNQ